MFEKKEKLTLAVENGEYQAQSKFKEIWRRLKKSKGAMIGLVMLIIMIIGIIFAPMFVSYETAITNDFSNMLAKPSADHWFGCDGYGRDIFARTIYGGRTSVGIALLATFASCIVGSLLGAVAGFFGGWVDSTIMRSLDIFMSVPDILFTMAVVYALGASFVNLIVALTLAYFTNYVRLVRSEVLTLSEQDYVEASRAGGASGFKIILSHILPNSIGVIIVNTTLNVAKIILYESTLSFLGLGISAPTASWGSMVSEGRMFLLQNPVFALSPGICVAVLVISLNVFGDGIRDALDPRLRGEL